MLLPDTWRLLLGRLDRRLPWCLFLDDLVHLLLDNRLLNGVRPRDLCLNLTLDVPSGCRLLNVSKVTLHLRANELK